MSGTTIATADGVRLASRWWEAPRPAGAAQRDLPGGMGTRYGRKLARAMQMLEQDGTRLTRMDEVAQAVGAGSPVGRTYCEV